MPRWLVLHLGMHETGTRAVQAALAGFDDGRTRMARLGPANHSVAMSTLFCADPPRYHLWVRQGLGADEVAARQVSFEGRLRAELALAREQLVISAEEMSLLDPPSIRRMLDWLAPQAGAIGVVGWLRPAAGYTAAAFAQMVKAGLAKPLLPRPRYRDRFGPYLDICGRDAVGLRLHDPADPLGEFCRALGIAQPAQPAPASPDPDAPLSADALRLIWAFNGSGVPWAGNIARLVARGRLIRHLAARHAGPASFPETAAAGAIDRADIAWAEGVTGFTLHQGRTTDMATGQAALMDWLAAHDPATIDRLDEDLDIIRTCTRTGASVAEKVAALYQALLDEVEAEQALQPVFRARNRAANDGARGRTRTGTPEG